jgi:hypothetical protein
VVCQAQPLVLGMAEGLLDELRDVGVRESVIHMRRFPAGLDHLGLPEQAQMAADGALGLVQSLDQLRDTSFPVNQQQHQLDTDGF